MSSDTSATTDDHASPPSVPKHRSRPSEAELIVGQILQQQQQQQTLPTPPSSASDLFSKQTNSVESSNNTLTMPSTPPASGAPTTTMRGLLQQASQARLSNLNSNAATAPTSTTSTANPPPSASPTLGETTAYLQTLHEEHDAANTRKTPLRPSTESFDNEQHPHQQQQDNAAPETTTTQAGAAALFDNASPMDRLTMMGSVLKAAAKLKQPIIVEQHQQQSSSSSDNSDREDNDHHHHPVVNGGGNGTTTTTTTPSGDDVRRSKNNNNNIPATPMNDIEAPATSRRQPPTTNSHNKTAQTQSQTPTNKKKHMGQRIHGAFRALPSAAGKTVRRAYDHSAQEWTSLAAFFRPQSANFLTLIFRFGVFGLIPFGGVAAFLFYQADNPPYGRCEKDKDPLSEACTTDEASISWWLLFLGVRQVIAWIFAKMTEVFCIDFLLLQHPWFVSLLGPRLTLILIQSKGWPSILFWWTIWNLVLLYGRDEFSDHWLYKQDYIALFTAENPAGNVTTAENYRRSLIASAVVAVAVCLKRYWICLHLGARLYSRYNERLKEAMKSILLVSELSMWAKTEKRKKKYIRSAATASQDHSSTLASRNEPKGDTFSPSRGTPFKSVQAMREQHDMNVARGEAEHAASASTESPAITRNAFFGGTPAIGEDQHQDLVQHMVPWEEPSTADGEDQHVTGMEIIEFRQAFAVLTKPLFFSAAYGPVGTREECLVSAEHLFRRLVIIGGDDNPDGEEIAVNLLDLTSQMFNGCQTPEEQNHALELIDLLKPDASGRVTLITLASAIDEVYREIKALEHAVNNHSHVEKSYEKVLNILFYIFLACIVVIIFGLNPLVIIASISALWLSFAFMIGSGVSQQFEGVLMVLVRQPYDVGDSIAISDNINVAEISGSRHWKVLKVDLVTTVAKHAATGEVASFSNGSLARARIMNMNRSTEPVVLLPVRFAVEVPYSTILVFRSAIEKFVADRPQEWSAFLAFRIVRVEYEQNFMEYMIVLTHRIKWQDIGKVLDSKAALSSFCVEVQKVLGCRYRAPAMGVELSMKNGGNGDISAPLGQYKTEESNSQNDIQEIAKQFEAKKDD